MKCPKCGAETRVIDKRDYEDGFATRRRRECLVCSYRFTTREYIRKDGDIDKKNIQQVVY